jgi:inhibitor of KinA
LSEQIFPRFRPVADRALLVEFGDSIDRQVHERVLQLDTALAAAPFDGFVEAVPAYASLLVCFDPVLIDHLTTQTSVLNLIQRGSAHAGADVLHEIEVCYDLAFGPDLGSVAQAGRLSVEQVIEAHLSGEYRVFMYGFAPGYAYLAGVPEAIRLPRKQTALRDIPAGSVLIAGQQCLVTTLAMPTGWWIIGRSPTSILHHDNPDRPFLFDIGDCVRFRRISRSQFDARAGQ